MMTERKKLALAITLCLALCAGLAAVIQGLAG